LPQNKKAELTKGSTFGSSAVLSLVGPAAFRPLLSKGLALSSEPNHLNLNQNSLSLSSKNLVGIVQEASEDSEDSVLFESKVRRNQKGVANDLQPLKLFW